LEGLSSLAKNVRESGLNLQNSIGRWETSVALVEEATEHLSGWSLHDPENNPNRVQAIDKKDRRRDQVVVAVNAKLRHSYMASAKELQNMLLMKCRLIGNYS
jgi:hypothetical protein